MTIKIALTGFTGSGKSVFLTSLLWYLLTYDDTQPTSNFTLEDNLRKYERFRIIQKKKVRNFPYQYFKEKLGKKEWPDRTSDLQHCFLECKHKDGFWKRVKSLRFFKNTCIEFIDFPGERLGDMAIYENKTFCDWSNDIFTNLSNSRIFNDYLNELKSIGKDITDEDFVKQATVSYKKCILKLVFFEFRSLISPASIILKDVNGEYLFTDFIEKNPKKLNDLDFRIKWMVDNGLSGLELDRQFCPLPEEIIASRREVVKLFSQYYKEYKTKYVIPFFKEILHVDSMAILIDIPNILASGSGKLEDQKALLTQVFDMLPKTFISKRIAFVASKADLVGKKNLIALESLLNSMVHSLDFNNRAVTKRFLCSACKSISNDNKGCLIGSDSKEPTAIQIAVLPNNWDQNWSPGKYKFSYVSPNTEENKDVPPDHYKLDKIFNFLVNNKKGE